MNKLELLGSLLMLETKTQQVRTLLVFEEKLNDVFEFEAEDHITCAIDDMERCLRLFPLEEPK